MSCENSIERCGNVACFVHALTVGQVLSEDDCEGLVGRICRGHGDQDFRQLSFGPARIAWMMNAAGLAHLTAARSHVKILRLVGFGLDHCEDAILNGHHFRVGVFPACCFAVQATWDGLLSMVDTCAPTVSRKVRLRESDLRSVPFTEIQQRAGFDFTAVKQQGLEDSRYVSMSRLENCEGTLVEVRAFLWNEFNVTALFDGTGFTRSSDGECGVAEYIAPNVEVSSIDGFQWIPLSISAEDFRKTDLG
eukprot:TRINITY_DN43857_c0_g1_i1.p1 TRINITY_DN43857_c0_g1~~TRINITY_DN43857_c0_g1_i1.p1  ORF type:complete len:249 (+),score=38.05 TRINITY_DN43857_c0_g1_i1:112-858(+)